MTRVERSVQKLSEQAHNIAREATPVFEHGNVVVEYTIPAAAMYKLLECLRDVGESSSAAADSEVIVHGLGEGVCDD